MMKYTKVTTTVTTTITSRGSRMITEEEKITYNLDKEEVVSTITTSREEEVETEETDMDIQEIFSCWMNDRM